MSTRTFIRQSPALTADAAERLIKGNAAPAAVPKPTATPAIGDDYKIDLSPASNDQYSVIMLKWTVSKQDHLPDGVRLVERLSNEAKDRDQKMKAIQMGFDKSLTEVGRKRSGRIDTGEKLIDANEVVVTVDLFNWFVEQNFILVDVFAERKPAGTGKFDKEKFILIAVFRRDNGKLVPFEGSPEFFDKVFDLTSTTFRHLQVWGNPDGTMTWNFGARAPDQAPAKIAEILDGKLGVYPV